MVLSRYGRDVSLFVCGAGVLTGLLGVAACSGSSSDDQEDVEQPNQSAGSASSAGSGGTPGSAGTPGTGGAYASSGGYAGSGGYGPVDGGGDRCSLGAFEPPTVPDPLLTAPEGTTLVYRLRAEGEQVYTCSVTPDGDGGIAYGWTFTEPAATMYDETCAPVGTHYAGPTWEWYADNSTAVGTRVAGATVDASAIPWLLLQVTETSEEGVFSDMTYIQRVSTAGGIAPSDDTCSATNVNTDLGVEYSAYYYFYAGP